MAGLEFGMDTNGAVSGKGFVPPPLDQLTHFLKDDHMNIIRFPIGWQYVQVGAIFDESFVLSLFNVNVR